MDYSFTTRTDGLLTDKMLVEVVNSIEQQRKLRREQFERIAAGVFTVVPK